MVPEHEGPTAEIFAQIRKALGVPMLHLFYPALGAYPAFLQLHWQVLAPVASSQEFFACADRLRADSYTRTHNYFHIPALPVAGPREEIMATMDFFHYKDPLLLLLFCLQLQALEGLAGQGKRKQAADPPTMRDKPQIVPEENAPAPLRGTYRDIRRTFDYPYVCSEFQALGRWPDFLRDYWSMLKQELVRSPLYDECRYAVRTTAWSLAAELPGPVELTLDQLAEAGLQQEEIASVGRILDLFVKTLSGSLLNVSAAKIALEGGNTPAKPAPKRQQADTRRGVA